VTGDSFSISNLEFSNLFSGKPRTARIFATIFNVRADLRTPHAFQANRKDRKDLEEKQML
jgi:hypothetical protein